MGIYQIIFTAWLILSVGVHLGLHGQRKTGTYSFWTALASAALQIALLYYGGFYG